MDYILNFVLDIISIKYLLYSRVLQYGKSWDKILQIKIF